MKTVGPMFSLGASGTIGGVITMATWKGRPYARVRVTPSNPRSQAQTANRAMMAYLSQVWAGLTTLAKESWAELGQQGSYSPFNAFVKANMNYWAQFLTPIEDSTDIDRTAMSAANALSATAGVKSATFGWDDAPAGDAVGMALMLQEGTFSTAAKNLVVKVVPRTVSGATQFIEVTGLKSGTEYFASFIQFNATGGISDMPTPINVTPT